jgi:5-methylcytosine-specific restriction endonuclease McrA
MTTTYPVNLSNRELLDATVRAARQEGRATADLLALLAEVDARRLYLGEGCSSLFTYCTRVLHLSEHAAYHRIEGARAARRFPKVFELVASGDVTLTTIAMLRPHLTPDNHEALLAAARHKSKRDVEHQIACLAPKPATAAMVRRVPDVMPAPSVNLLTNVEQRTVDATTNVTPAMVVTTAARRAHVASLASDRYLLRVTLSADAHAQLRRAQDLMRHTVPTGDVTQIVSQALTLLVDHLEGMKIAKASRPRRISKPSRSRNRHIPAHVRREVWARDGGRCAFVGSQGRCMETGGLEFHHLMPFAQGGATDVANISLRCRAHNGFESEMVFGPWRPPGVVAACPPQPPAKAGPS